MYSIRTILESQITPELRACWFELLHELPALDSPYFHPDFTRLVAMVRSDVEIAIIESDQNVVGLFPYQRGQFGRAKPVGGRLSDFHGIIAEPSVVRSLGDILCQCNLNSFQFDHLLAGQFPPEISQFSIAGSPYLGMSRGFEEYQRVQKHYSKHYVQYQRKQAKIQREHGELRLVLHSDSESDFNQLLCWKQEQYQRTGAFNPMRFGWTIDLLRKIWAERDPSFRGLFSTLHIGDKLVGAHFGMQAGSTLHYWFPAYNPEFHKYSPGNLLLLEIARSVSLNGITKIDFGKGTEDYKLCFGSAQTLVAEGSAARSSLASKLDSTYLSARDWLKSSPLGAPAKATAKLLRPVREWLAFR
jgi:CelD/BcsL family acetyltransferase involved in cellulose biosynthesis